MKIPRISNKELLENAYETSLSSTASGSTLSVYSISGVAINNVLLIGEFSEGSEIIKTHSSTAPTGITITLASALVKSHPKDTKVYVIPYDQAQFYHATTSTGVKTLISTSDIDEESSETKYEDGTYTSGYYFVRFYNSINGNYTDYSDPIPYEGFATNTVGYIIDISMKELKKEFSDVLTFDSILSEINACLRYIRGKLKRWSNTQEFDYVLDQINRGEYNWSLPTTYYDKNSNRSMLQVKYGNDPLYYKDKIEFDDYFEDTVKTTVATTASLGATSLVLTSSDDLPEEGTFHVYINNTAYDITVTANDQSTNTLTCSATTVEIPAGTNIFYGEAEGTPKYFSIWDGSLYIWPLCDSSNYGKNIYLDFYTDIVSVDSDADEITLARFDMVKHWVKWAIKNITENNGTPDFTDGDWVMFNTCLNDAIRRESSGQKFKSKVKVNGISYRSEINESFDKS
jgi:hypothetical protein